jgi:hypothetical protein
MGVGYMTTGAKSKRIKFAGKNRLIYSFKDDFRMIFL